MIRFFKPNPGPGLTILLVVMVAMTLPSCGDSGNGPGDAFETVDAVDKTDIATDIPGDAIDGEFTPSSAAEWIAEGKRQLRDGEAGFAVKAFEEAVALEPDNTDALFGMALAGMVYGSELFVMAVSLIDQFMSEPGPIFPAAFGRLPGPVVSISSALETPPDDWSQNEYLASEIHRIFMRIRDHFVTAIEYLEKVKDRDLNFEVEAVPVYLGIKPMLMYRGIFDAGDVHLMNAIANTVVGITDVLAGQDLTTDVLTLVGFVKSGLDSGTTDAKAVFEYAAYLLSQDERFLTLHAEDGEYLFNDAQERFAAAGPAIATGMDKARGLGDGAEQISLVEDTGDKHVLRVRSRVRYQADGVPYEEDIVFHFTDDILQALGDASDSIEDNGDPVTLHGAILPILAVMLSAASQCGVLDAVGLELPIDLGAFEIPGVVALLQSLLPNVMAFDWGEFFKEPVGLRAWLPAITEGMGVFEDTVIVEWECPDDLDEHGYPSGSLGLLCGSDAELIDSSHFQGSQYEIEADGIASGFPVFAFPDPTLNSLAMVDLDGEEGSTDSSTFELADGSSLNAALAKLLDGILALVP